MRRGVPIAALVFAICMMSRPATAQGLSVGFGYAWLHDTTYGTYPRGWIADVTVPVKPALEVVGDVSRSSRLEVDPHDTFRQAVYSVLGGIRLIRPSPLRVRPFLTLAAGLWRYDYAFGGHANEFAFQLGGGADVAVAKHFGARLEADYRVVHKQRGFTSSELQYRLAAGVYVAFGR